MMRRMLAPLAIALLAVVWIARADDPVKPKPPAASADAPIDELVKKLATIKDQTSLKQEILAQQFRNFEQSLLSLAQRLEKSTKPEDRDKAVILKQAIELAGKEGIDTRFDKLISLLKSSKVDNLQDVQGAITESEKLVTDLRALLALLLSDNRAAQIKAEEKRISDLIKEINRIIRDEKTIRAQNDGGRMDKDSLGKAQSGVTKNTEAVAKAIAGDKGAEGKAGDNKGDGKTGGKGSENKGEGKSDTTKDGKGTGKDTEGKSGSGKEGSGKEGSGKEGSGKEGSGKEGSGKEGSGKEGSGKEGKEGSGKEGSGKEGSGKEGSGKEGSGKEGAGKSGKESGSQAKGAGKEGGEKSGAGKSGKEGGKSGEKGGEAKSGGDGKGEGKSGGKGSESKGGGKSGQGQEQSGQGKDGGDEGGSKQKPQPPSPNQPQTPGKKQVQDAIEAQKRAEENIKKAEREGASKDLDDAIKQLEEAKKKLEELLRQLREEEIERLLAALQARCERMLQMQIEVYEGTVRVDKAIGENPDKKPTRANEQKSLQLADREEEIVKEANKAIQLLETEGSAVAFPRVFEELRDDMKVVARRLGKADVAVVTQSIEQDIIATLKEMIEALKKARQEQQARQGQPPPPGQQGPPPPQSLIDQIAELKMIRSMQIRVNNRTETYAKQYQGEQAEVAEIRDELKNLADRQQKIQEITRDIATGKNR